MRHSNRSRLLALALAASVACSNGEHATPNPDAAVVRALAGSWVMTMVVERPMTLAFDATRVSTSRTDTIAGRMALIESHERGHAAPGMASPSLIGVCDLDFARVGLASTFARGTNSVAARVVRVAQMDSVFLLIDPDDESLTLSLAGIASGGVITGMWHAESFLGGGGSFRMRRETGS